MVRPDDADEIVDDIEEVSRERPMAWPGRLGWAVWLAWQVLAAFVHGIADRASDRVRAFRGVDGQMLRALRSNIPLDVRHSVRRIVRAPGFTAVVVLTMAIGIGTSTAVFSVVRTVLLEPLPYPEADRLVRLVETVPPHETPRGVAEERTVMDAERVVRWRASTRTLSEIGTYLSTSATIVTADGASRAVLARVSSEIFPMLGARMQLGRPFLVNDERSDSRIVVLSADAHKSYFGGATDVVGRTLALDGVAVVTVAVLSLSAARALTGQTPQSEDYDVTRKVGIKGMLVGGAAPAPPHPVYLLVTVTDAKGNEQHWAVEGDSADRLRERGYRDDALTMGGIIAVTGYAPRAGQQPQRRMPLPLRGAMERAFDLAKEGRLILGTEITLADGTKIPFGRIE